jgi:nucleoside-diphosphate-sugar epimerase
MTRKEKAIVIGASGQIGTDLVEKLRELYGVDNVVASDIKGASDTVMNDGPFEILDVLDGNKLAEVIEKHKITQVYLLAALLSATAEAKIKSAWKLNMDGLFNVLDLAKEKKIEKIFWPSSIAIFGPSTPKEKTPQNTIAEPSTVYGISKLAGERWCEYYYKKFGVDVRSIRYPGLIGYKSLPGGGTTDYAVQIFHDAILKGNFECFLGKQTTLPMMYMPDAIKATIDLMHAPSEKLSARYGYNIAGMSFSPKEIAAEVKKYFPAFEITYMPDHRQQIADSWPHSIDDTYAKMEWGWKAEYDLEKMTNDMFKHLIPLLKNPELQKH